MDVKSKQELLPFFVYGTLLPGQPNAYLWGEAVAAQQTAVLPNGRLYDLGSFPMLVEEGEEAVQGMLIWVRPAEYTAVVASLDELEGYDPAQPLASAYRRVRRLVKGSDGRSIPAWVYVGHSAALPDMQPISGGDWVSYVAATFRDIQQWWQDVQSVHGLLQPPSD